MIALILSVGVSVTLAMGLSVPDESAGVLDDHGVSYDLIYDADTDGNGSPDRTMLYVGETLTAVAWDTNGDTRHDLWLRFDEGLFVTREIADLDWDGKPDEILDIDRSGVATSVPVPTTNPWLPIGGVVILIGTATAGYAVFRFRKAATVAVVVVVCSTFIPVLPAEAQEGLFTDDCELNEERFEDEWVKYSDFDDRIPIESASYPVQQFNTVAEHTRGLYIDRWELEIDQAFEEEARQALRDTKTAIVLNQRNNTIKATVRLFAFTFLTMDKARRAGNSIIHLIAPTTLVEHFGAVLKLYDSFKPKVDAAKTDMRSSVESVAWSSFKGALESAGDPKSIVKGLVTSTVKQGWKAVPTLKLTDDEFKILRDELVKQRNIDKDIAESSRYEREIRTTIEAIDTQIAEFESTLDRHRDAEKDRVRGFLIDDCERSRQNATDQTTDTSLPDNALVVGTWRKADETTSYDFRDDGTYTFSSNYEQATGSYKLVVEDGTPKLLWLDPSDPSGQTHLFSSDVDRDGDTLTLTTGGEAVAFVTGDLIVPGEGVTLEAVVIDRSKVYRDSSSYSVRLHSNLLGDCSQGTQSALMVMADYELDLRYDLDTGTLTGGASVVYACQDCTDSRTVSASAEVTVVDTTFLQEGSQWEYEGIASVVLVFEGVSDDGLEVCTWNHGGRYDVPFTGKIDALNDSGSISMEINHLHDTDLQVEPVWSWGLSYMFNLE